MRTIISEKRLRAMLEQSLRETAQQDIKKQSTFARIIDFLRGSGIDRMKFVVPETGTFQKIKPDGTYGDADVLESVQLDTQAAFAKVIGSGGTEIGALFEDVTDNPIAANVLEKIKSIFKKDNLHIINSNDLDNNSPFSDLIVGVTESFARDKRPVISEDIVVDTSQNLIDLSNMYLVSLKATSNIKKDSKDFYDPIGNSKIKPQTIFQLIDLIISKFSNELIGAGIDPNKSIKVKYKIGVMGLSPELLVTNEGAASASKISSLSTGSRDLLRSAIYSIFQQSLIAGGVFLKFINQPITMDYTFRTENPSSSVASVELYNRISTPINGHTIPKLNNYFDIFCNNLKNKISADHGGDSATVQDDNITVGNGKSAKTIPGKKIEINITSSAITKNLFKQYVTSAQQDAILQVVNANYSTASNEFKTFFMNYLFRYIPTGKLANKFEIDTLPTAKGVTVYKFELFIPKTDVANYNNTYFSISSSEDPKDSTKISSTTGVDNFMMALWAYASTGAGSTFADPGVTPTSTSAYTDKYFYLGFGSLSNFIGLGDRSNVGNAVAAFLKPHILSTDRSAKLELIKELAAGIESGIPDPERTGSHSDLDPATRTLSGTIENLFKAIGEKYSETLYPTERDDDGNLVDTESQPNRKKRLRVFINNLQFILGTVIEQIKNGKLDQELTDEQKEHYKNLPAASTETSSSPTETLEEGIFDFAGKFYKLTILSKRLIFLFRDILNDVRADDFDISNYGDRIEDILNIIPDQNIAEKINTIFENLINQVNQIDVDSSLQEAKLYNDIVRDIMEAAKKKRKSVKRL